MPRPNNVYISGQSFRTVDLSGGVTGMPSCALFEIYKTPSGSTYYICHRPPFGEEGTMLPNGEIHCQKCDKRK